MQAQVFQAFRQLVQQHTGALPVLRCVLPRTLWAVPTGYTYDAGLDAYTNLAGLTWTPVTANLPCVDVGILPSRGALEIDMVAGGLIDTGDRIVRILPADKAIIDSAAFFVLDGIEYNLAELTPNPAGAAMFYTVRLAKR